MGKISFSTKRIHAEALADGAIYRLNQLKHLQGVLKKKCEKAPDNRLRISRNQKTFQYYLVSKTNKSSYIKVEQMQQAAAIAQFNYDSKLLEQVNQEIDTLQEFIDHYHPENFDKVYSSLHPGRQKLITPIRLPDADFVKTWREHAYTGKDFEENAPEFFSNSGIRVRSKSEIIIANALDKAGVPYRYEAPHTFDRTTLHPDFTCLDIRNRSEIIWEHFGLMGDSDYARTAIHKIALYASNGFILGKSLIATFERSDTALSTKLVQQYAEMIAAGVFAGETSEP